MAYDTTEAVAKFLSGFQMKITNRERDTVAPDYYVKYLLTAEVATDFGQDIDDIAGRANPYVLSVDTVRAVNEKGYDAVFAEQWKAELSECDIDPEAVSVDSEAHDMENGRDGLDDNAPEKDAPEKDDRDAQPPVDTDNR